MGCRWLGLLEAGLEWRLEFGGFDGIVCGEWVLCWDEAAYFGNYTLGF